MAGDEAFCPQTSCGTESNQLAPMTPAPNAAPFTLIHSLHPLKQVHAAEWVEHGWELWIDEPGIESWVPIKRAVLTEPSQETYMALIEQEAPWHCPRNRSGQPWPRDAAWFTARPPLQLPLQRRVLPGRCFSKLAARALETCV